MTLTPGSRLGPYEILSPLGAGGMGEVYRARDARLARDVAVKVLPEEFFEGEERRQRFEREARLLAALNHPGIAAIYSFEEIPSSSLSSSTRHVLVMELVEGQGLDSLIAPGGLALSRFLDIAVPLADAISAAHERGIVHRDLKPGNVMVTRDGRVKVLDFGLAKLESHDPDPGLTNTPTESRANLTAEGQVYGTVAYMSPEQARAGKVDARSDVFSLGVVLYQMLTGERPFQGATAVDMISSILRDRPHSVTELRPELPPHLARVLRRCLEKDPRDRYQTSRDVYNELKELRTETSLASSAPSPRSVTGSSARPPSGSISADEGFWVAVLPFKHGGGNADLATLAEGLSEEVVAGLSRFSYLRVITSGSTQRYADQAPDLREVGKELGARYVMSGKLRQVGARVRIAVQLVDASTGAQLWAETYERPFRPDAIFELQDDVVPRIVSTVADWYGALPHSMSEALRNKSADQMSPYEALLRSFGYYEIGSPEAHAAARQGLERAVQQAPDSADSWAMLSFMYGEEFRFGMNALPDPLGRALQAARRAVDAAPSNHFAYAALAQVLYFRKEFDAFRTAAERAIALNPMDGSTIEYMGHLIAFSGDWERGYELAERGRELNPNYPGWYWAVPFHNAYRNRDYAGARALVLRSKNTAPNILLGTMLAAVLGQLGEREAAAQAVRELLAVSPDWARMGRRVLETWYQPEHVEHLIDGLRKAGLEIAGEEGAPISGAARADEGFWVAVLPFKYRGTDPGLEALAEGLTGDIGTGLSRFSYLRVIARRSTSRHASESVDVRSAGKELGARYVMEGNLRQAGGKLRLAVQLVDAVSGAHLWAENYERTFSTEAAFELQDDLVPRIVSTCADRFGVLARSISDAVRNGERGQIGPYEALMRGFGYHQRLTPAEHAEAREALERAVERAPSNADCWAMLSWIYSHEHAHGFNVLPGSLERALAAARRAVDIAPSNQLAQQALAVVLFFRKETASCLSAAERAIALNPLDTSNEAMFLIAFTGDWDCGCALIRRAMELNPHHPRWYGTVLGINEYRLANYRAAVDEVVKANSPEVFWSHMLLVAAHGQLGELAAARNALRDLLVQKEDFAQSAAELLDKWFEPRLVGLVMEGLRKAGLEISVEKGSAAAAADSARSSTADSGAARADEGFWVAVLPFKYSGANAELAALAEGLTEDIVTGLSRFSYLRVVARGSTAIEARYLMEGSLRQAGTKLRLSVQLVDAVSGAHLWAEHYERAFSTEAVFDLQDDLVPRIVSTVADSHGVLLHSMSEALRSKSSDQLSPYEAVLRSFGYFERVSAEELAAARSALELAVRKAPDYADAWAMLALLCAQEYGQGYSLLADSLAAGSIAARRAVEAGPSNHLAHSSLAQVLFLQKELQAFRNAAARAAALNPMDGATVALMGILLAYAGDWEHGCAVAEGAMRLNPHFPGWYRLATIVNAYRLRDYRAALDAALRIQMPGYFWTPVFCAAAFGQLGEREAARKALGELLAMRPEFGRAVRAEFGKWHEPELVEHFVEGLRKAGLDVPDTAGSAPAPKTARSELVSIAVLPFSDLSAAKDQDYLCEGMAEEIMNALVGAGGIRVAARTSAFRAARQGEELSAIARTLNVGHVLEGSVRTSGSRLRVTAQLTDVATGFQVWSEKFDREAADVFAVQDEIAAGVVEAVRSRLGAGGPAVPARPQVKNLEAYQHYLKGRHLRYTKNDHGAALLSFEKAVALDPSHGPSWVGLADIHVLAAAYGMRPSGEACAQAKAELATAARLQGETADARYVEGMIAFSERRWADADQAMARAIQIEPGNVQAHCWSAVLLSIRGRVEEAIEALERAREIDPLAPYPYAMSGFCLLNLRRAAEAERYAGQALAFDEDNLLAIWVGGAADVSRGQFDQAIARLERAAARASGNPFTHGTLGWAFAAAGRTGEAHGVLEALRTRAVPGATVLSEAWLLAALGETEEAFGVLRRASDENLLLVPFTGMPGYDPLRADPRFEAFVAKLGMPAAR